MAALDWDNLLSTKRERHSNRDQNKELVVRNEFEADYDRIVGSSSVRRLQDKAQVFPLQQNDVARTRLTHSIEVSAMARSLGKAVGKQLESKNIFDVEKTDQLTALLQVAGLIHDLGNPPFGHYGETVIQNWFTNWFHSSPILATHHVVLTKQEQNDFCFFDGNVQNLRIVSKLQTHNDTYGANFTYATLGTIIKYPWPSDRRRNNNKKFGYFKTEEYLAKDIQMTLGLAEGVRHPATYLLEAADDIIYLCDDIEDGVKKQYIDWDKEYNRIKKNLDGSQHLKELFKRIDEKYIDERMDEQERIIAHSRNFRNSVQSYLFKQAVQSFVDNYDKIMSNSPEYASLELLEGEKKLTSQLKRVTRENCFACKEVLTLESAGDKVISSLLDIFVSAVIQGTGRELTDVKNYNGKLFRRISPNFVYRVLNDHLPVEEIKKEIDDKAKAEVNGSDEYLSKKLDNLSLYDRLHLVTDFISGMTDSYAVNLYLELNGIKYS